MKNKGLLVMLGLCLALVLMALPFMSACAKPAPAPAPAPEEPIKLKTICFLPVDLPYSELWLDYIDRIEEASGGRLVIENLGGPEVIPAEEQTDAVMEGIIDIFPGTCDFWSPMMPEARCFYYTRDSAMDQRKTGFFDLMVEAHKTLNMRYLGRNCQEPFYITLDKMVNDPREDFKPLKIRTTDAYTVFLDALGCAQVTMPRSDLYGALERGVCDGQLSPPGLVLGAAYNEVQKYMVFPPCFQSDVVSMMNLERFESLPKDLQDVFVKVSEDFEPVQWDFWNNKVAEWNELLLTEGGMEKIEFTGADAEFYLDCIKLQIEDTRRLAKTEYGDAIIDAVLAGY